MARKGEQSALGRLVMEFPATSGLLTATGESLERFFREPDYDRCVAEGGPVALTFGDWLAARAASDLRSSTLASLELAMARLQRQKIQPENERESDELLFAPERLTLTYRALVVERPQGTSMLHAEVLSRLGPHPEEVILEGGLDRRHLPGLALSGQETLLLLLDDREKGVVPRCRVERPTPERAGLLLFAQEPRSRRELAEEARALGADETLVDALLAERLLRPCS